MEMASFIALPFTKNMALLPLEEPKKCTRDGNGIIHSFTLGEPKIGTEKDLAPQARIKAQETLGNECYVKGSSKPGYGV